MIRFAWLLVAMALSVVFGLWLGSSFGVVGMIVAMPGGFIIGLLCSLIADTFED